MLWEKNSFIDKPNRIAFNATTFYATIDPIDDRELRFFWQIFIVPFNLLDNLIPLRQLTLASSNYVYSLQEAKQIVQEKILEYKLRGVA